MGSMYTALPNRTSGIHRAQTMCANRPSSVCFNAPPVTGHRQHTAEDNDEQRRQVRQTHVPTGTYGTP